MTGRNGTGRGRWLALRLVQGLATLFVVSILIFAATQALPGDVARLILGVHATPERLATVREQLGLTQPLYVQYWRWFTGVLHGDFGTSLINGQPVSALLGVRLRNSVTLSAIALVIMLPVSLVVGIAAAQRKDRAVDRSFLGLSMIANATPEFVLGTVLVALLGTNVFKIFPPVSIIPPSHMPWWHPGAMVLPVTTLVIGGVMYLSRLVRVSFIDVLSSEYIQAARLKGLSTARILFKHTLPNALAPAIPAASLVAAFTVGGVVVVEYLFAYPGVGSALVDSVGNRDVPVVQAIVLIIAVTYFLLNLVADVLGNRGSGR
ncbi:ABC transporter permease [Pseudonocardia acaciae]|uniref:ABC transporter permease n=1 Tax=Pseudonocardia acaciae TaxID=551276 RepID=UPI00048B9295|nr:ABC transporter permease [Pseudonocardia acaciae]